MWQWEKSIPQGPNWGQLSSARQEAQPHRNGGNQSISHHMQADTMAFSCGDSNNNGPAPREPWPNYLMLDSWSYRLARAYSSCSKQHSQ